MRKKSIEELKRIRVLEGRSLLKIKPLSERAKIKQDIKRIRAARFRQRTASLEKGITKTGKAIKGTLKFGGDIVEGLINMFPEPPKKKGKKPKDIFGGF